MVYVAMCMADTRGVFLLVQRQTHLADTRGVSLLVQRQTHLVDTRGVSLQVQRQTHFRKTFLRLLKQPPLRPRAHHVVLGIPNLIIGVAVEVIG